MTTTAKGRRVRRETLAEWRGRRLVIELHGFEVSIRPKGTRTAYRASYEQIFKLGAENEVKRRKAERAARRKAAA